MSEMERTLTILKPDAVQRGLCGELLARFERRGLKIVGLKLIQVPQALAEEHYAEHAGRPFYPGLIEYITSGPVVVFALQGPDAVVVVRSTVGSTRPAESTPGSIRADYGLMVGRNLVHASDSTASAERELALWFGDGELVDYTRDIDRWILERP
jgi:nucleoside-diphosphate kinase